MKNPCKLVAPMERLRDEIAKAGSQEAVAQRLGISPQYLCDVLKGRREPGKRLLGALGYRRVVVYQIKGVEPDAKDALPPGPEGALAGDWNSHMDAVRDDIAAMRSVVTTPASDASPVKEQ